MLRLLNIEFHKLKHNRASRVLTIIYFALLTSIALIAAIKFDIGVIKFHLADQGIFNFPYIWHFNTYMASIFKFFLLLVIVSMMANEYSNKTLKQNLIDGLSKKEFILSKFYTVIVFAAISTFFVFVVSMTLGLIYSDFNELSIIFSDLDYLFAFFIKLTAFFSFGLFMGILVKRSAFAVGGILVWFFVESIFKLFLFWKFNSDKLASNDTISSDSLSSIGVNDIMQFFPLESMANLIKQPFTKLNAIQTAGKQLGQNFAFDVSVHWYQIAIATVWIFIFIYASYALLKKRDL
ncbi:ABC transporter permease [Aureibaculum luteum]|uniref:ABC transporter permease n=1 Tax=Aureibaculum luteum TaxID=1548456 RepID=UPI000E4E9E59|nr:ABC transporter permease subunit [Aureibaculum luteum]